MLLEYKNFQAQLHYCPKTKGYYGEVLGLEEGLIFQATNRQQAITLMQYAIDVHLAQAQSLF